MARALRSTISTSDPAWRGTVIEIAGEVISPTTALVVLGATVIGGFLRGFVGFGGALAVVPALALALGPRTAVAIASLVGLPAVFQLLPEVIRHADRQRAVPAAIAILIGAPLGSLILTTLSPKVMTGAIGALVIVMALSTWKTPSKRIADRTWINVVAGFLSGVLQGAAGIGGPPSVAVLLAQGGEPRLTRANVLAATAAIAICGAVSHLWFGIFTVKSAILALALLPFFVGSTWAGSRFFATGGQQHFRLAATAVLVVIGALTLVASVR